LTPGPRQVIGDVIQRDGGRYPAVPPPIVPPAYYRDRKARAQAFDLFFGRRDGVGTYIPADLVPRLRALAPASPPYLASRDDPVWCQ